MSLELFQNEKKRKSDPLDELEVPESKRINYFHDQVQEFNQELDVAFFPENGISSDLQISLVSKSPHFENLQKVSNICRQVEIQTSPFQPKTIFSERSKADIFEHLYIFQDKYYVDISPFFLYSQKVLAEKLNIPPSTFSKRWSEACPTRKWPCRRLKKLKTELETLYLTHFKMLEMDSNAIGNEIIKVSKEEPAHRRIAKRSVQVIVQEMTELSKQVFIRLSPTHNNEIQTLNDFISL